jgi:hypothetical protein
MKNFMEFPTIYYYTVTHDYTVSRILDVHHDLSFGLTTEGRQAKQIKTVNNGANKGLLY